MNVKGIAQQSPQKMLRASIHTWLRADGWWVSTDLETWKISARNAWRNEKLSAEEQQKKGIGGQVRNLLFGRAKSILPGRRKWLKTWDSIWGSRPRLLNMPVWHK